MLAVKEILQRSLDDGVITVKFVYSYESGYYFGGIYSDHRNRLPPHETALSAGLLTVNFAENGKIPEARSQGLGIGPDWEQDPKRLTELFGIPITKRAFFPSL